MRALPFVQRESTERSLLTVAVSTLVSRLALAPLCWCRSAQRAFELKPLRIRPRYIRAFPPPASDRNAQPRRRAPDRRASPRRAAGRGPSGQPICTRAGRARREPPHRARHHPAAARRPKGQLPDRMLREPDAGAPRPRAAEHPALHAAHCLCTRLATRAILTHSARTVSHPTATHPTATPHADAAALARVSSTCPATCQSSSTAPW